MPKMKTKSAASKRFRLTGSGQIKRKHGYKGHLAPHKTHKQKRQLRKYGLVDRTDYGRVRYLISK